MTNEKLISEVGANIRQLRLAQAKGQAEVANALEISVAALSKIENGQTDINISRLAQIAKYFEVSVSSIISNEVTTSVSQNVVEEITDVQRLQPCVAVQLLIVGVGDGLKLGFISR